MNKPQVMILMFDSKNLQEGESYEHARLRILAEVHELFKDEYRFVGEYDIVGDKQHDSHGLVLNILLVHKAAKNDWNMDYLKELAGV